MPRPFANVRPRQTPATNAGDESVELANLKRQLAQSKQAEAQAAQAAKEAADSARALTAALDTRHRDDFIAREATKAKALNVPHIAKLIGDDFEVKVSATGERSVHVRGKPDVKPDEHIAGWFKTDGAAYVAASIAGGAGASQSAGVAQQGTAHDLKTVTGKNAFLKETFGAQ